MRIFYQGKSGSGKTQKLINEYVRVLRDEKLLIDNFLFFSLDKKSISDRLIPNIKNNVTAGYGELWLDNFSSFCRKILKKHFLLVNLPPQFEVISGFEERLILEKILQDLKLVCFDRMKKFDSFLDALVDVIDTISLNEENFFNNDVNVNKELQLKKNDLVNIYKAYQGELKIKNFVDYRGLIVRTIGLLKANNDILSYYKKLFKYVFIDDVEEISYLEYELVKLLFLDAENVLFAGCIDESIYKFRGADSLKFIPQIANDFKCNIVNCEVSNIVVDKQFQVCSSLYEEIVYVARKIRELILSGEYNFKDISIIRREFDSSTSNMLKNIFTLYEIPFHFYGDGSVFSHPKIISTIFTLKILDKISQNKIFDIDDKWLVNIFLDNKNDFRVYSDFMFILKIAKKYKKNIYKIISDFLDDKLEKYILSELNNISSEFKNFANKKIVFFRNIVAEDLEIKNLVYKVMLENGLWNDVLSQNYDDDRRKYLKFYKIIDDFEEMYKRIYDKEKLGLTSFVEYLDKMLSSYAVDTSLENNNENVVDITTIQKFKTRKSKVVFFIGLAEDIIPRSFRENDILSFDEKKILGVAWLKDSDEFLNIEARIFDIALNSATEKMFCSVANKYNNTEYNLSSFVVLKNVFTLEEIEYAKENVFRLDDVYGFDKDLALAQTRRECALNKIYLDKNIDNVKRAKIKHDWFKDFRFSASSINEFKKCPAMFMFDKLIRLNFDTDLVLSFGSIIHEILEEFHKIYVNFKMLNDAGLRNQSQNIINRIFDEKAFLFASIVEREWYKSKANKIVSDYIDDILEDTGWSILNLEKYFVFKICDYSFVGKIDRIDKRDDGVIEIIDYKTGTPTALTDKKFDSLLETGDDYQLVLYYYAVDSLIGKMPDRLSYYWLTKERGKRVNNRKAGIDTSSRRELLGHARDLMIEDVKKMDTRIFKHKPKNIYDCGRCRYRFLCDRIEE